MTGAAPREVRRSVRPQSATTKRAQRLASIGRLLDAAQGLFVSQGYRQTNLDQIASAAGLTKGAVYFYFRSKETVLLELLKRVQAIVVDQARKVVAGAGPGAVDRLVAFLHQQSKLGVTHRDAVLLLILMSLEFSERRGAARNMLRRVYRQLYDLVERLVQDGQRAGEIRADVRARELSAIVMAIHDGTFLEWYRRSPALSGPEVVRALRGVLLTGISRPPARALAGGARRIQARAA